MSKRIIFPLLITFFIGVAAVVYAFRVTQQQNETDEESQTSVVSQTFILMGDAGTASPAQNNVAQSIVTHCEKRENCLAAFIIGDVIYDEGVTSVTDTKFQTHFEEPYAAVTFPFYIAYGNHDYLGCTQCYLKYAKTSEKWRMPDRYYVEEFDSVAFFVIDTEKFDDEQQTWLKERLTESTVEHKVVLGHRPLQSDEVEKHLENWNGKKELTDIVCNQADYYVSGHAHILENPGPLENCSVNLLISGTAGSYPRGIIKNADSPFHASVNGFLSFEVNRDIVKYSFIDELGNVLNSNF